MDITINKLNKAEPNNTESEEILAVVGSDLDSFSEQIRSVEVVISDINGPKGGCDQECSLRVKMKRQGTFFAKVRCYDPIDATREATYKIIRQMVKNKSLDRKRNRKARTMKSEQDWLLDSIA